MTVKEHKKTCRIKVEKLAKLFTFSTIISTLIVGHLFGVSDLSLAIAVTAIWFYCPDMYAYCLELYYHIKHNKLTYR